MQLKFLFDCLVFTVCFFNMKGKIQRDTNTLSLHSLVMFLPYLPWSVLKDIYSLSEHGRKSTSDVCTMGKVQFISWITHKEYTEKKAHGEGIFPSASLGFILPQYCQLHTTSLSIAFY